MIEDLTGILLAGGQSRRFGSNKALAPWENGKKLLESPLKAMTIVIPLTIVLSKCPDDLVFLERPNVRIARDLFEEQHPLGGIYTGLTISKTEHVFVSACDMPFLRAELIEKLWGSSQGYDVNVPVWNGKPQTLCGIYSKRCLGAIETMIKEKDYSLQNLLKMVRSSLIPESEVREADFEGLSFRDIDTQTDYEINRTR